MLSNGDLLSCGNCPALPYITEHSPARLTNGTTESYRYDADGERVVRTAGGVNTIFFQGVWVQTTTGTRTLYYTFNGEVVAMRNSANIVTWLHGDHLGSVSMTSNSVGQVVGTQDFTPWGAVRGSSTVSQTSLNFIGQRLDVTGLLYYHARYYNPVLARFVSADTIVPGVGALTVAPSDATAQAAWAQGAKDRDGRPIAPRDPQTLNRYSYVNNNPIKNTDPTGHCIFIVLDTIVCAAAGAIAIGVLAWVAIDSSVRYAREHPTNWNDYTRRSDTSDEDDYEDNRNYNGPFEQNGVRTSDEFWGHLDDRGITEEEAYDAYKQGSKYTAANGSRVRWDPSTGVTVVIGKDGAVVTTWKQGGRPSREWKKGW